MSLSLRANQYELFKEQILKKEKKFEDFFPFDTGFLNMNSLDLETKLRRTNNCCEAFPSSLNSKIKHPKISILVNCLKDIASLEYENYMKRRFSSQPLQENPGIDKKDIYLQVEKMFFRLLFCILSYLSVS